MWFIRSVKVTDLNNEETDQKLFLDIWDLPQTHSPDVQSIICNIQRAQFDNMTFISQENNISWSFETHLSL